MGREPEDIGTDDLPAIVVLIQLIYLIVCQVVSCKVIAQYPHLWGGNDVGWRVCARSVCICAERVFFFCTMKGLKLMLDR